MVEAGRRFKWLECHLQQSQRPSCIAAGPAIWLQQPGLWRQDQGTGGVAAHLLPLALPSRMLPWLGHTWWFRGGNEGTHGGLAGKTVSWGLTSLIHDKVIERNAVSGFHSTAGHFTSLNTIGAEKRKLNIFYFHEKDISTSCQFLALHFRGSSILFLCYLTICFLILCFLKRRDLSQLLYPSLHWVSSWESICGKKCTILPGKCPKGSFASIKMTCQHFPFNTRFLPFCSRGFGLWYLQIILRSWGGRCIVMVRYQLHTDVRHLLGEYKEALKQSW